MNFKNILSTLLCGFLLFTIYLLPQTSNNATIAEPFKEPMNFVSVCDEEHYPWLLILLNSIKDNNLNKTINIIVFDIGLSVEQRNSIEKDYGAIVYQIELVHSDLTKKFVVRPNGRLARGWYAWKPVAIKQAFDYFDYFLYIDAGKRLTGPSDNIFHAIKNDGYFFFDCGHIINPMTTHKVKVKFHLDESQNAGILQQFGLEAGIQGLSRKIYNNYVLPMYHLAHEIDWFSDDGSAPWGFGGARHDQTLFSIIARIQNYTVHKVCGDGPSYFFVKGKKVLFNRNHYFQFKLYKDNPLAKTNNLL